MKHLGMETILAYIADKLEDEETFHLETHLAECRDCVNRVHRFFVLRENFNELWDSWTVKNMEKEVLQVRLFEAVKRMKLSEKDHRRATRWIREISRKTEMILGITLDTTERVAKVIQEGLEEVFHPRPPLVFSPIKPSVRLWGDHGKNIIAIETKGTPWIRVTIDPDVGRVAVQGELIPKPWPLVVLIPREKARVHIQEFYHPEGTDYLLAQFGDIPDGNYILLLEAIQ